MTVQMRGGPELDALLRQLPEKLQTNVLRGAARAGARVIAKEAKVRVPKATGLTAKSIKVDTSTRNGVVKATIRTRGRHSYLAPFLEYGVAGHFISIAEADTPTTETRRGPRKVSIGQVNKMAKRGSLVISQHFVGPVVQHPGVRAHPFFRPALDAKAKEAINAAGQYIATRLKLGNLNAPLLEADEE